ncbi:hypothetical protein FRC12_015268 [Ceratobasidium sp. 428]|nr:hypothetical protein FRC12_015268 [Ceratobasidium sp. 428]
MFGGVSGHDNDLLPLSHTATTESVESVGNGGTTGGTNGGNGNNQDYGRSVVDRELGFDGGSEGESGRGDEFDKGNYPNGRAVPDSHIDPGLLAQSVNSGTTLQEQRQPRPKMRPVPPVDSVLQTSEPTGEQDAYAQIHNPYPAMPPPPPLPSASHLNPVHAVPSKSTAGAPSRQTQSSIANKTPDTPLVESQSSMPNNHSMPEPIPNAALVPRKRGRPVGSKNKKKGEE